MGKYPTWSTRRAKNGVGRTKMNLGRSLLSLGKRWDVSVFGLHFAALSQGVLRLLFKLVSWPF